MVMSLCSPELYCFLHWLADDGDAEGSKLAAVASDPVVTYMRREKMS